MSCRRFLSKAGGFQGACGFASQLLIFFIVAIGSGRHCLFWIPQWARLDLPYQQDSQYHERSF